MSFKSALHAPLREQHLFGPDADPPAEAGAGEQVVNCAAPLEGRHAREALRILTIAACPMPARRGTPVRIERLSEALMARGHEVTIATYHIGEVADPGRLDIVRIGHRFLAGSLPPGPTLAKLLRYDPALLVTVGRLLASRSFDVIHAHHVEGLVIAALARPRGMPLVFDAHTMLGSELPSYVAQLWKGMVRGVASGLDRLLPRLADHVICAGARTRDALIERYGFPEDRVSVAWNGVEMQHFAGAFAARGSSGGGVAHGKPPRLLYTGTLAGYQNIELLLEAFARLHRTHPAVRLVLASRSPFDTSARLAERLGIASMIDVEDDDFAALPAQLADATLAVLPRTECDGVPQKLLNYMAAGCPVVASRGSAALLEHEATGLVVANSDADAFAHAMRRLIDDPALAESLGRRAHDNVARNFAWSSTAATVEAIYRSLLLRAEQRATVYRGRERSSPRGAWTPRR